MKKKLISIPGEEFLRKVLAGERDFERIELKNFDFGAFKGFGELQTYLKTQNLKERPLLLGDAYILNVYAAGIHLPYLKAQSSFLRGVILNHATLRYGDFFYATFDRVDLRGAEKEGLQLEGAQLKAVLGLEERLRCKPSKGRGVYGKIQGNKFVPRDSLFVRWFGNRDLF